jgi:Spy/CpxP family protein refolding chaperone
MKFRYFVSCAFVCAAALATPYAVDAQLTNSPAPGASPGLRVQPLRSAPAGQPPAASGYSLGGPIGVLTPEQRASYEAAMGKERGKMAELQSKLRVARQDLVVASVTEKFDENAIRQKAMVGARIEAEMTVLRIKAMSQVQPPLTAEQIEKVKATQPGPMRPGARPPLERSPRVTSPANTNQDANGLPPKK